MPRARLLKPDFFRDEELCECSFEARLLFAGLWTIADRNGRLEHRVKRIKADIFPYDNVDVEKHLNELNGKFVTIYEIDGLKFIQINNFDKHQHPHPKEPKSAIPGMPKAKQLPDIVLPLAGNLQNNTEPIAKTSESIPSESIPSESIPSESIPSESIPSQNSGEPTASQIPEEKNSCNLEESNFEPIERDPEKKPEFRAAWDAFEKWSLAATRFPLRRGANLERWVWQLIESVEKELPIIHGGKQVPQPLLIPNAIEALIAKNCEFKSASSGLKWHIRCVQNQLDEWAKQGLKEKEKAKPKENMFGKGENAIQQQMQARLEKERSQKPPAGVSP